MSYRIGIFGGSFDPPHNGHFLCARIAAEKLNLARVLVIPAAAQPHKNSGAAAPAETRWRMVVAAVSGDPLLEPSRLELDRGGVSYTVDTLSIVSQQYHLSSDELFLLVGADALNEIDTWRQPQRILELARLAVMKRPGDEIKILPENWLKRIDFIDTPLIDISSTWLRRRAACGLPLCWAVPDNVANIIEQEKLYQTL